MSLLSARAQARLKRPVSMFDRFCVYGPSSRLDGSLLQDRMVTVHDGTRELACQWQFFTQDFFFIDASLILIACT